MRSRRGLLKEGAAAGGAALAVGPARSGAGSLGLGSLGRSSLGLASLGSGSMGLAAAARAEAGDPIVAPVLVTGRRVSTQVYACGRGPYRFLIDTGAYVTSINEATAHAIPELRFEQNIMIGGVGGVRLAPLYSAGDFIIGEALHQRNVALAGLVNPVGDADGLLAAGLLVSHDTDLDFVRQELRIWRGVRPTRTGYAPLVTEIVPGVQGSSPKIRVEAEIDGVNGRFTADTGAPRPLALGPRLTARTGLWRADRPYAPFFASGVGGREAKPQRVVRARSLRIGPLLIEGPLVALTDPAFDQPVFGDGLLGFAALRRMNLSYELAARRLWASPNGLMPTAQPYPRSGLLLEPAGESRLRVREVGFGSPGAEAGVRAGDLLADTSQAAALGQVGQAAPLRLKRAGAEVQVAVTPRDYL